MDFLQELGTWLSDPAHWQGPAGIPARLLEHLAISAPPVLLAAAVGLPLGVALGHHRRGSLAVIQLANVGRALPTFAVLVLALPLSIRLGLGIGYWPAFIALIVLALPPILTNAHTGVVQVDPAVVESARAMGMRGGRVATGVEVPLALPVLVAGVRVSSVQVVATATLAALIGGGGLGRFIIDGMAVGDLPQVFVGGALVALLAVTVELGFELGERACTPPGLREQRGLGPAAEVALGTRAA